MTFFLSLQLLLVYEAIWRSNSGSNPLKNDNFPSRNKEDPLNTHNHPYKTMWLLPRLSQPQAKAGLKDEWNP